MHPSIGAMFVMRTSIPQPRTQEFHINQKWILAHLLSHVPVSTEGTRKESWAQHSPGTSPLTQGDVQELMIHHADPQEHGPALQRKGPTRKLFCLLQARWVWPTCSLCDQLHFHQPAQMVWAKARCWSEQLFETEDVVQESPGCLCDPQHRVLMAPQRLVKSTGNVWRTRFILLSMVPLPYRRYHEVSEIGHWQNSILLQPQRVKGNLTLCSPCVHGL